MKNILFVFIIGFLFLSCKNNPVDKLKDLDLMKDGIPLVVKAPEGAKVSVSDLGLVKDVTIVGDNKYSIQLMSSKISDYGVEELLKSELELVQAGKYFSKIVTQDERGFIYEKNIDEVLNYDFRSIKIQGEYEFNFQRALVGNFTLEEVQLMYAAVK